MPDCVLAAVVWGLVCWIEVKYNQPSDSKEITIVSFISGEDLFSIRFELTENSYVDMDKIRNLIPLMIHSIKAV